MTAATVRMHHGEEERRAEKKTHAPMDVPATREEHLLRGVFSSLVRTERFLQCMCK